MPEQIRHDANPAGIGRARYPCTTKKGDPIAGAALFLSCGQQGQSPASSVDTACRRLALLECDLAVAKSSLQLRLT